MSQAILSLLGGWWARLSSRAGSPRTPAAMAAPAARPVPAAEAPVQEPAKPPVREAARTAAPFTKTTAPFGKTASPFNEKEVEKSFWETIRMQAPAAPAKPKLTPEETREATLKALGELKQIPALQSLVQGVTQVMGKDGVGIDEIVAALQKDQALCVRIFSMANSAAVASEQKITELQAAVQMLGIASVRRVAQAVFTLRGAQEMGGGLDWRHLWVHALATAAVAEELDRRINPTPSSQVYLAGLLHDVGKIALSTVDAEAYRDIVVSSWNAAGRLEDLEVARLGVGHREAGTIFAKANRLPETALEVIAHHDNPAEAKTHRVEVALVSMANFMVKARGLGFSGARLDATDGDLEDSAAVKVLAEETGRPVNVAELQADLHGFFTALRGELKALS